MLTKGQERAFDAYFESVEQADSRGSSRADRERPTQLLKIVHCSLGRVNGRVGAVLKYLVDHEDAHLIDIHRATKLGVEELAAILRKRKLFTIKMTKGGCLYGVKYSSKID